MLAFFIKRLLWMIPSLLGISLLTFLLLDLVPADRAEIEIARNSANQGREARDAAIHQLRMRYGLIDRETGEPRSVWLRYAGWLENAARLDFADVGEDAGHFRQRFLSALLVSTLLGSLAVLIAVTIAVLLGAFIGMRSGGLLDRGVSALLLICHGLPQFLLATLVVLSINTEALSGLFPGGGLRSVGSQYQPLGLQLVDLARHLVLPVMIIALAPTTMLLRLVRESVARAAQSSFVHSLRCWGLSQRQIRARVLRHGLTPLATMSGTLIPSLVSGSLVVEIVFDIPGMSPMIYRAIEAREYALVMAGVMLVAVMALLGMMISDSLQRLVDPRVKLA